MKKAKEQNNDVNITLISETACAVLNSYRKPLNPRQVTYGYDKGEKHYSLFFLFNNSLIKVKFKESDFIFKSITECYDIIHERIIQSFFRQI